MRLIKDNLKKYYWGQLTPKEKKFLIFLRDNITNIIKTNNEIDNDTRLYLIKMADIITQIFKNRLSYPKSNYLLNNEIISFFKIQSTTNLIANIINQLKKYQIKITFIDIDPCEFSQ